MAAGLGVATVWFRWMRTNICGQITAVNGKCGQNAAHSLRLDSVRLIWIFGLLAGSLAAFPAMAGPMNGIEQVCDYAPNADDCEAAKLNFTKMDLPSALKGKALSQRNVAACLEKGCDGAMAPDLPAACAWNMVVVTSNALTDSSDAANYRRTCMKAGKSGLANARVMAEQAFRMIYKRKMPESPSMF